MAIERGIVTKVFNSHALVLSSRSSACESCSSRDACHGMGGAGNQAEIEVINSAGAKPGDSVLISFKTSSLFKLTFLLYIFPIIFLFFGALLGEHLSASFGNDPSKISALFGFIFFSISLLIVIVVSRKLETKKEYTPEIIRIVPHEPFKACDRNQLK